MKHRENHGNMNVMNKLRFCSLNSKTLLLPVDDFRNSMADYCPCLFNLFPGQAGGHADLQRRKKELPGFKIVIEKLQTGNEDSICRALEQLDKL